MRAVRPRCRDLGGGGFVGLPPRTDPSLGSRFGIPNSRYGVAWDTVKGLRKRRQRSIKKRIVTAAKTANMGKGEPHENGPTWKLRPGNQRRCPGHDELRGSGQGLARMERGAG